MKIKIGSFELEIEFEALLPLIGGIVIITAIIAEVVSK